MASGDPRNKAGDGWGVVGVLAAVGVVGTAIARSFPDTWLAAPASTWLCLSALVLVSVVYAVAFALGAGFWQPGGPVADPQLPPPPVDLTDAGECSGPPTAPLPRPPGGGHPDGATTTRGAG